MSEAYDPANPDYYRRKLESELDRLRAELERERMRIVACGVVASANTPETAAEARKMHDDYRSASCDDVAAAVDREMRLRKENAALREALAPFIQATLTDNGHIIGLMREDFDRARAALQGAKDSAAQEGDK